MSAAIGLSEPYPYTPYCGNPPDAADLWVRWNLDPVLITILLLILAAYVARFEPRFWRLGAPPPWRRVAFYSGWGLGAAALITPLCALSVSLFSARISQHMLLETVVAPLIALGLPRWRGRSQRTELLAAGVFTAAFWFWHAPGPYTATFYGDLVYWTMHLTLFGSALWLWRVVLDAPADRLIPCALATVAVGVQMALLGAVITLAGHPLYPPHSFTTRAWGFSPLADQQLGGVIMWVPAGVIFTASILTSLAAVLRREPKDAAVLAAS